MIRAVLLGMLACSGAQAAAPTETSVCFNYGCLSQARVELPESLLLRLTTQIGTAPDAAAERRHLAEAIGELYLEAGRQSPISADRAGDYLDEGVHGKMDCIDHAVSTTRLLRLLEWRGALRFHQVGAAARRTRFIVFQHFSAVIEELRPPGAAEAPASRFVVDSWFVEHGEAAVVLPLEAWLDGEGPNVQ